MLVWKCFEMHCHTLHSDGSMSPAELCGQAKEFLYDGIALTDHNTMSALEELSPGLIEKTVPVIPGIEWTTYYGHMLVIGAEKYVDWRFARPDTIDEYTALVKEAGGAAGIAHPFNLGSPMCTGCHWDFKVKNWDNIDYIEVWSQPYPQRSLKNTLAFEWWTSLLNRGHHLAATAGWDWHGPARLKTVLPSGTWLGLEEGALNPRTVKAALIAGRSIITSGPFPEISLRQGGRDFYPGDSLEPGDAEIAIALDETRRRTVWESFGIRTARIDLVHNGRPRESFSPGGSGIAGKTLNLSPGWFRVEGYGTIENAENQRIFFSSPYYVGGGDSY
jgi:hypothetical protein